MREFTDHIESFSAATNCYVVKLHTGYFSNIRAEDLNEIRRILENELDVPMHKDDSLLEWAVNLKVPFRWVYTVETDTSPPEDPTLRVFCRVKLLWVAR